MKIYYSKPYATEAEARNDLAFMGKANLPNWGVAMSPECKFFIFNATEE